MLCKAYKLNSGRKLLVNYLSKKELVSRICKEFSKVNSKKPKRNNPIRKLAKDISQEKTSRWQINNRSYSQKYVIREILIQMKIKRHMSIKWLKFKNSNKTKCSS